MYIIVFINICPSRSPFDIHPKLYNSHNCFLSMYTQKNTKIRKFYNYHVMSIFFMCNQLILKLIMLYRLFFLIRSADSKTNQLIVIASMTFFTFSFFLMLIFSECRNIISLLIITWKWPKIWAQHMKLSYDLSKFIYWYRFIYQYFLTLTYIIYISITIYSHNHQNKRRNPAIS